MAKKPNLLTLAKAFRRKFPAEFAMSDFDDFCRNSGISHVEQRNELHTLIKNTEAEKNKRETVASYISDSFFVDAVRYKDNIVFLRMNGVEQVEFTDSVEDARGNVLYPLDPSAADSRLLRIPTLDDNFDHTKIPLVVDVFQEMKATIQQVWDAGNDNNLELTALWIVASYRFDLVGVAPYLRLRGEYGSGKTRGLDCIAHLAMRPLSVGPGLTEAVVFRLCEQYKPTACLNEFDEKGKGDYASLAVQLLNSRYERGHPIGRVGGMNRDEVQLFDPFGPTAFSARNAFTDTSLESRCLEIVCQETDRDDIPDIVTPEYFEKLFVPIRNRLYQAVRLRSFRQDTLSLPTRTEMPRRFRQLLTALWAALPTELQPTFLALAKRLREEEKVRLQNSDEGEIWGMIFDWTEKNRKEFDFHITASLVADWCEATPRSAGRKLSAMGFTLHKKDGVRFWRCSKRVWTRAGHKLGITCEYPDTWIEKSEAVTEVIKHDDPQHKL